MYKGRPLLILAILVLAITISATAAFAVDACNVQAGTGNFNSNVNVAGKVNATEFCINGKNCASDWGAIFGSTNNVGIGISIDPLSRFHVQGAGIQSGTGTIEPTGTTSTTVTGTGTKFSTELHVGDSIILGAGGTRTITAIASDTSLTIDSPTTTGHSGTFTFQQPVVRVATNDGTYSLVANALGRIGIGTASPLAKLDLVGGGMRIDYANPTGNLFQVDNASAYGLVVDKNLNVGVGISIPASKLDIAGTAKMTGFQLTTGASNGYFLKSDASGIGTWQAVPTPTLSTVTAAGATTTTSIAADGGMRVLPANGYMFNGGGATGDEGIYGADGIVKIKANGVDIAAFDSSGSLAVTSLPTAAWGSSIAVTKPSNALNAAFVVNPYGTLSSSNVAWTAGLRENTNNFSFTTWYTGSSGSKNIMTLENTGNVSIPALPNCGKVYTDTNGKLRCGVDAGGIALSAIKTWAQAGQSTIIDSAVAINSYGATGLSITPTESTSIVAGNAYINFNNKAAALKANILWNITNSVFVINGQTTNTSINPYGGNVGIGTTTPETKFDVQDANNPMIQVKDTTSGVRTAMQSKHGTGNNLGWIGTASNHPLYIGAYSNSAIIIATNQNVGIGADPPTEKLDVNGNVKVREDLTVGGQIQISGGSPGGGKVLTSDSIGMGTWQTPTYATTLDAVTAGAGKTTTHSIVVDNSTTAELILKNPKGESHIFTYNDNGDLYLGADVGKNIHLYQAHDGNANAIYLAGNTVSISGAAEVRPAIYTAWGTTAGTSDTCPGTDNTNAYACGSTVIDSCIDYASKYPATPSRIVRCGGDAFTVTRTGQVGIGIASPIYKLDVAGTIHLNRGINEGQAIMVNSVEALWKGADNHFSWGFEGTYNFFRQGLTIGARDVAAPANGIILTSAGTNQPKVTITAGDNTPEAGRIIFGDTSDWQFNFKRSDGSKIMTVLSSGNVGIGIDAPSQKLTVAGNIYTTPADSGIYTNWITSPAGNNDAVKLSGHSLIIGRVYYYSGSFAMNSGLDIFVDGAIQIRTDVTTMVAFKLNNPTGADITAVLSGAVDDNLYYYTDSTSGTRNSISGIGSFTAGKLLIKAGVHTYYLYAENTAGSATFMLNPGWIPAGVIPLTAN